MAMKFRAHETFFIRKGWLSKGMKCVARKNDVFVSKEENPMDVLGIGSNMVKALRYWLQAVGLTSEPRSGKRIQTFTELGELIYKNDRYIEEQGTLCLLQYKLATNREEATAWYYFFNEFSVSEFSREDFVESIQKYIKMSENSSEVALRSLNDDFACIINTYLPRNKMTTGVVSPENNIDSPFGELGLIDIVNKKKKTYRKKSPVAGVINPWIALAIIVDQANGRKEIGFNDLLSASCNIGRVYNLDSISMVSLLYEIEKTGFLKINRTAGLDVVSILKPISFRECIERYYAAINKIK